MSDLSAVVGTRRTMKELVDGTIRVQIDIDPPHRAAFLALFPNIDVPVALAPLNLKGGESTDAARSDLAGAAVGQGAAHPKHAERSLAQQLHIRGDFRALPLWLACHDHGIYTMQQHKRYVEGLKCIALSQACDGDVCMHHVHGAHLPAAGKDRQPEAPQKPPHFFGVPLCHHHHNSWAHGSATRGEKECLLVKAIDLTAKQIREAIKTHLMLTSLSDITPPVWDTFVEEIGLRNYRGK